MALAYVLGISGPSIAVLALYYRRWLLLIVVPRGPLGVLGYSRGLESPISTIIILPISSSLGLSSSLGAIGALERLIDLGSTRALGALGLLGLLGLLGSSLAFIGLNKTVSSLLRTLF
jgi:hypothetical protein